MAAMVLAKVAVIREPGYPPGVTAPCTLKCPCGARPPANLCEIRCTCGRRYTADGWLIGERE